MNAILNKQGICKNKEFQGVKWENVTSIFALLFVFGKSVFVPKKILYSFLLIIIFVIGSLPIVPYYFAYAATTNLVLFLISSFVYGSIFYSFRKSTLFENIQATNLSKFAIYFSIFIIMFLFTAMAYLFIIVFFIIGISLNSPLFMDDWFFTTGDYGSGGHLITELNAQLMVWWFVAFILLNFSLFYLFQNIAKSQKTFYLFVFFYLFLILIYGNALIAPTYTPTFVLSEEHPFFSKFPTGSENIYKYIDFGWAKPMFLCPNIDYPFDPSFYLDTSPLIKGKIANHNYFAAMMILLTPHYWINVYSANLMKATCLSSYTFNPKVTNAFYDLYPDSTLWHNVGVQISDFKRDYVWSTYSFENAKIWSLQNGTGWVLGMYLWIVYFALFTFVGRFFSKTIYYKN